MELLSGNLILILCFVVGTALLLLEAFMPGFGVAGGFGVLLEIIAIVTAWRNHGPVTGLIVALLAILLVGLAVFLSYRSFRNGRLSKSPLVLNETESAAPEASPLARWDGREGVVATPLRPAGFIEIDGERVSAATAGDFLEKGRPVKVTGIDGDHVLVRAVEIPIPPPVPRKAGKPKPTL